MIMKVILLILFIPFSLYSFGQISSNIEYSYDFSPSRIVHYDLSKTGDYSTKYKQPYYYIGTLMYNQNINNSTIGFGVRGFWINGNEKSFGAQLDYYRYLPSCTGILVGYGANLQWDAYRFKDYQGLTVRHRSQSIKLMPSVKLLWPAMRTKWGFKTSLGLGVGISSSEYTIQGFGWLQEESVDRQDLLSSPFIAPSFNIGVYRRFIKPKG